MATVSTIQAILAKLNAANGLSLTYKDVAFEQITTTTTAEANANGGANTKAFVRPIAKLTPTLKPTGVWVFYNRVSLATAFALNPTTAMAFSEINSAANNPWVIQQGKYSLNHQMRDLAPQILTTAPSGNFTYVAVPAKTSVGYVGNSVALTYTHAGSGFFSNEGDYGFCRPGKQGAVYQNQALIYGGGVWSSVSITSGTVPPGLTVGQVSGTGVGQNQITITGTPTTPGTYTFTYTLNGLGTSQTRTIVIHPTTVTGWAASFNGNVQTDGYRYTMNSTDGAIGKARGAFDLTSGSKKWYFQFDLYWVGGDNTFELGLCDPDIPMDGTMASDYVGAWMIQQFTGEMRSGGQYYPGMTLGALQLAYGGFFVNAQAVGVAVDATDPANVKVWIRPGGNYWADTNGVAANPATGAGPSFVFDSKGKSLFPCMSCTFGSALGTANPPRISLRMSSLDHQSTAPAGFSTAFTN